ncbi:MAG TPA: methyltransferase domain-containing protein [Anaerolineales bacterium]|nr:methyltransferase domain-containing protein [Anaerolineales bacterium]HLO32264.1 methyltransferase domain-containing protein [Anaerolineales bacterium]
MPASMLYDLYLHQENKWKTYVTEQIGEGTVLLDASSDILNSRTYQLNNRVIKIRKLQSDCDSKTKLNKEYEVESYLDNTLKDCAFEPHYEIRNGYELLSTNYKRGMLVERLLERKELALRDVLRIVAAVLKINLKGVCHRDLKSDNIRIDPSKTISLIDFDQAIRTTPIKAIVNDFLGVGLGLPSAIHPLRRLIQRVISYKAPGLGRALRAIKKAGSSNGNATVQTLTEKTAMTPELSKLKTAWELAARSNASTPGAQSAYYGLTLDSYGFLGERSWESRWDAIKPVVKFEGKSILELGCNMGLFSTFMRLNGAHRAVGLDIDRDIIQAAEMIAEAFGVDNEYYVQDLDDQKPWEEQYQGFDVVFALSVMNWIKDKNRLLAFLAKHREIVYEGHDSFEIEYERLSLCGFKNVEIVSVSERGRVVFYAKK